jgi:hypothetical protein
VQAIGIHNLHFESLLARFLNRCTHGCLFRSLSFASTILEKIPEWTPVKIAHLANSLTPAELAELLGFEANARMPRLPVALRDARAELLELLGIESSGLPRVRLTAAEWAAKHGRGLRVGSLTAARTSR